MFESTFSQESVSDHTNKQANSSDQIKELEEKLAKLQVEIQQAEKKADQIVAEAEKEAQSIRDQLKNDQDEAFQEMERLKQEAKEEGYAQGQVEGLESYTNLIDHARVIVKQSEQEYEKTIDAAQPVILELAAALTQRMMNKKLSEDPDMWSSILEQVMTEVREHENVRIYVHPNWYERTSQQKEELEQLLSHTENLFIYPDAGLMKNGCVIESKYGRIDATVDRQLNELKTMLLEKLKEGEYVREGTY
jgi:flagellar assembly protein FliH